MNEYAINISADLLEGTEKACHVYSAKCLSVSLINFSQLFYVIYDMCFQLTYFSCDDCENVLFVLFHHDHEIGNMNHLAIVHG